MKRIALVTNFNISDKLAVADKVGKKLAEHAEQILIPIAYKDKIFRNRMHRSAYSYKEPEALYAEADLVVVIGGDGSMLDAARRAAKVGTPVLGINMGRIGYMTELEPDELELLDKVFSGDFYLDERAMLNVKIVSQKGQTRFSAEALNEAVVANGVAARIIDVELFDGEDAICTYRADGLVVATPTGSTAYSLSAGGPIVDPRLSCICVTPVCPHSLLARPMIFPDTAQLRVKNICVREKVLHLTVDGKATFEMYYGDMAVITKSSITAKLLRIKDNESGAKIRLKKLV